MKRVPLWGWLIGHGGAVYLLSNERVMGESGIIGGLVGGSGRTMLADRLLFLASVQSAPALILRLTGTEASTTITGS